MGDYRYPAWAGSYLDQWIRWATHSRSKPTRDLAWGVKRREQGILGYFRARVANASAEGMNRKAKVVSRRAYGYESVPAFQLALYHVPGAFRCRNSPVNSYEELLFSNGSRLGNNTSMAGNKMLSKRLFMHHIQGQLRKNWYLPWLPGI